MTSAKRHGINLFMTVLFLAFYGLSLKNIESYQDVSLPASQSVGVWDLSPTILHIVAGEFKGLMADYLTLDVGAQLGSEVIRDSEGGNRMVVKETDCDLALKKFQASLNLDPSFLHTMNLAQGWLPWDCQMVDETMEMLKVYELNRPWDWQPARFMAFNNYYFFNNRAEAGRIFLEAAKKGNAPDYLSILGSRLSMEGGQNETATLFVKSMLQDMPEDDPGYEDLWQRYQALLGVQVLINAKKLYEQQFGKSLQTISDLVTAGVVLELPVNPYRLDYCLDSDGVIHFDDVNCE